MSKRKEGKDRGRAERIPVGTLVRVATGTGEGAIGQVADVDTDRGHPDMYTVVFTEGTLAYNKKLDKDTSKSLVNVMLPYAVEDLIVVPDL